LIVTEKRVEDLKNMHLQATQAAQQAKAAVQQNANLLQNKLAERQKLLSQLDQARMQQQLNTAMATLSQTVGQDVPTFDEVRTKIEAQYAKALGTAELSGQGVDARMLEIEQASLTTEAQLRLDQMRNQMGLPAGETAGTAALPTSQASPAGALGTGALGTQTDADTHVTDAEEVAEPAAPGDA
jgi:phage shock protein A